MAMCKHEQAGSPKRVSETIETLGWLADQVLVDSPATGEARMADALSVARSYLVEFAVHRSLGASDSDAASATARRELKFDEHRLSQSVN
jgi:hypothetical protein